MVVQGKALHKKYRIPKTLTVAELREKGQKKISKNLRYKEDRKLRHKLKMETKNLVNGGEDNCIRD